MSCCGNRSKSTAVPAPLARAIAAGAVVKNVTAPQMTVHFEYTGDNQLAAVGPVTGRSYRFNAPGQVLPVDLRDVAGLSLVPKLRRLRRA